MGTAIGLNAMHNATVTGLNEDEAWTAVTARDRARDGDFVYAVATTGVYCRPSCASRRALRKHVRFFAGPDDAEAAGYRACLRCHPRDAARPIDRAVERARGYLEAHVDEPVTLTMLAREVGVSPYHLQRAFSRAVGVSPKRYAATLRTDRLKSALRGGATVSRATFEAGYGASSRVYEAADAQLGMTPAAYRNGGRGQHIRYTTRATAFGRVLVAATERGVCAVQLGDREAPLEQTLAAEYPNARRERVGRQSRAAEPPDLRAWADAIVEHLEGTDRRLAVPTDVPGTVFELKVWQALRDIPYGETRSYSDVARAVGAPRAARAVASACAHNPVAVVIPCHRVVRRGGDVGGYRWGLDRKRRLLDHEREGREQERRARG